jgi:hypothetical protein
MNIAKEVSAREFLWYSRNRRNSIKSAKIVLPKLGSNTLGKIIITLKHESKQVTVK